MHLIDWIVLHAPHIEFVEAIYGSVKGRTLHALIDRPVKRINLELSASSRDMGQYEFVHHHVTLGVHSSLQDIKCTIDTAFMGSRDWLHLIADLQQLTSLEICLQYGGDTSSLVNLLARLSLGCTSLENVTLTFFSFSPPGEWIQPLSQHPRLKSLVIVCNMMAEGMLPVLKEFRHLDLLQLKLKTFDLKTIAQLKSEIPCLVFTTQSAHQ
ncbi:hypothetical protein O0I10_006637 [Lichtheimia ornata]|uniref:Uncharacterized protein n=1 Tax=Lichtheimia ornata TaxID=688661 RepID=A0AAD7V1F7_9FUNG|nr:uncharacterized protein O0I10_006637 [Lichtheimia ornata]KAJ8657573.1 hypothetical protein O0I10_006637 [Lichtheimia ornata]